MFVIACFIAIFSSVPPLCRILSREECHREHYLVWIQTNPSFEFCHCWHILQKIKFVIEKKKNFNSNIALVWLYNLKSKF